MHACNTTRLAGTVALAVSTGAGAYDVNDKLSIGGILAAVGQCQEVSARLPPETDGEPPGDSVGPPLLDDSMDAFGSECRGGMPFQLAVDYHPDGANELFLRLGFAVDNGLSSVSPWALVPWAADLEDDVEDINGRGRDYLLAAWYKHTLSLGQDSTLGATIGILDSTEYLDENAYANDEYTQFMNEVFVNSGSYGLPSYDAGAALEWQSGPWSVSAVGMNIGENEDGNNSNFWGAQAGYEASTSMGTGNYRVIVAGASSDFLDRTGTREESRLAWGLSFDQAFGGMVGAFLRLAWQNEDAAVDYKALYSGGLNLSGSGWGREADTIGIGYAYLEGGNGDIDHSQVFETYYRLGLNDYVGLTADVQYMEDDITWRDPRQENPKGWILGMRLTAEF
ncbi:MAG: carbohydrate porin [Thiocapsa sp.]|nr:carbohydrate porin [Thiocapsa sp.]MCG6985230.1 carbohydrate porin [Thiocapsa sp.]